MRRRPAVSGLLVVVLAVSACTQTGPDAATTSRGTEVFANSCASCHGGPTGGEISAIPPVLNANGHAWHHPDCVLEDIIRSGLPPRADPDFPVMRGFEEELDGSEVEATIKLIRSWWTPQQREQQAELTAMTCVDADGSAD